LHLYIYLGKPQEGPGDPVIQSVSRACVSSIDPSRLAWLGQRVYLGGIETCCTCQSPLNRLRWTSSFVPKAPIPAKQSAYSSFVRSVPTIRLAAAAAPREAPLLCYDLGLYRDMLLQLDRWHRQ
jgi:hypothetical protein